MKAATLLIYFISLGSVYPFDSDPETSDQLSSSSPNLSSFSRIEHPLYNFDSKSSNRSDNGYSKDPIASTLCGTFKGYTVSDGSLVEFDQFLGIHYAEPPVKQLRFKYPVPYKGYQVGKEYQATKFCPPCMQPKEKALETSKMSPSENCLCLNIYRPPDCNKDKLKPVLVYIYGSYFVQGSAAQVDNYGGYLAYYGDFIVVTLNYRLGAFGWLYGGNKEIPGNMGYHDTLLAAQWVKKYIKDFGGDPKSITIAGHGSGGTIVTGYLFDPDVPKDLYRSLMILSPDYNQKDFVDPYWVAARKSKDFTELVDCKRDGPNSRGLNGEEIKCLKRANSQLLAEASIKISVDDGNGICAFTQLFPLYLPKEKSIDYRLAKGLFFKKKSIYIGGVSTETYRSLIGSEVDTITEAAELIKSKIEPIIKKKDPETIRYIIDYYLGGISRNFNWYYYAVGKRTAESINNVCYGCPIYDLVTHVSKDNKVFAYYYDYVASCDKDSSKRMYGAFHGDDIAISFGVPLWDAGRYSNYDRIVSLEMMDTWSDFVYHRKMKWPRVNLTSKKPAHYLAVIKGEGKKNFFEFSPLVNICPKLDA